MAPEKRKHNDISQTKEPKTTQTEGYIFKGMKRKKKETKRDFFERCLNKDLSKKLRKQKNKSKISSMIDPDDTKLEDIEKYLIDI